MPLTLGETVQQGSGLQKTYIEFFSPLRWTGDVVVQSPQGSNRPQRHRCSDETSIEALRGKKVKLGTLSTRTSIYLLRESRQTLYDYNGLLNRSHIDIGTLDEPRYQRTTDDGRTQIININQGRHCVRRVFSRGSFECNGRYYGGWWQSCPKAYRKHIRINRQPTIEVDYSAMHPMILSAEKGIQLEEDPYTLTTKISEQIDPHTQRQLVKGLCCCRSMRPTRIKPTKHLEVSIATSLTSL